MGEINTNQPIPRLPEDKWDEITHLPEEELRQVLSDEQQDLCHLVITELAKRISTDSPLKPSNETISKIVHCLPDKAADYSFTLTTILNYMKTHDIFNVQSKGWFELNAWTGKAEPDPELLKKIKTNAREGDGKFALALLKQGFVVSDKDLGELFITACLKREKDLLGFIIDKIQNNMRVINQQDLTTIQNYCVAALTWASSHGETETLEKLVKFENKINRRFNINMINNNGDTLLHFAVSSGHHDTVIKLIELGVKVNTQNLEGKTPLHSATIGGNKELALMLVLEGARTDLADNEGNKPQLETLTEDLRDSIIEGKPITLFLIRSGVPIKNDFLFLACKSNDLEVANELIKKDINLIHFEDGSGDTPLHWACRHGNESLATTLIEKGADFLIANKHGHTPMSDAPFKKSFFIDHAYAYIKKLDGEFGNKIYSELGHSSTDTLFALTGLLKKLENNKQFLKDNIVYKYLTTYVYGSYQGEDYKKRLENAISNGLPTLAKQIGGSQFEQDFITHYAQSVSKSHVFDHPFLTASPQEKIRMVHLAKAQNTCSALILTLSNKGYPIDVVENAIIRYLQLHHDKLPTEDVIYPFCFDAVIENALGSLPAEKKKAIIALFNTLNGKEIPLTKEGQNRLAFLATKLASLEFAEGRSAAHFRAKNKFPVILQAMHISDVNSLNNFGNNELFGEMFDGLQSDVFKNINADELLEKALNNPSKAFLSLLTPIVTSLLGGEKLDEKTAENLEKIAEGLSEAFSYKIQFLKRDDVRVLARALEFTLDASTEKIFSELLEGINAAKKDPSSFTQQIVQKAADYLFSQPSGVLDGHITSLGIGLAKQFMSRDWLVKKVLNLAVQALPYLINAKVNSLNSVSPEITILTEKILSNLINNLDLDKADNLITKWQHYDVETSLRHKSKKEAKEQIVNMLYETIITLIKEVQKATPNLFDGVLLGIKEISSQDLSIQRDDRIPIFPLSEEKKVITSTQNITKDLEAELIRLSSPGRLFSATIPQKEFQQIKELQPEFQKEFEGLNPTISELVELLRKGSALLEKGYSVKEIAMGCKKSFEAHNSDNLYPFVFDAVVEILIDDVIHSGKTRSGETRILKEKLEFYLKHISKETPLNEKGRAVLKVMIDTLLDPEFCKGLPLLHPHILERFPLMLQGANLSSVDRLNSKKSEFIRKLLIDESDVCLRKINIGNIKNGIFQHPQEFMMRIISPLINVLTPGLSPEIKQENERVVRELISVFLMISPVQNLMSDASTLIKDYNLHGIELDADFSLEGLSNELKNTTNQLLNTLYRTGLPSSKSVESMVLTQALLSIAKQFSEAQNLRAEFASYKNKLSEQKRVISSLKWEIENAERNAKDTTKTEAERGTAKQKAANLIIDLQSEEKKLEKLKIQLAPLMAEKKIEIASNKVATQLEELSGFGMIFGSVVGKAFDPSNTKMLEKILTWGKPWIAPLILSPLKEEITKLVQKDSDKLLISETIKANEDKIANLLFNIVLANLPLLNNVSKILDLVNYVGILSSLPEERVDQVRLMRLMVESIDVVLDNIVIFKDVIPTLFDALRRVQALDQKPEWLEKPPEVIPKNEKAIFIEGVSPKGITNIGNSCFLNSTMQVLIANPSFREKLMDAHWVGFVKFVDGVKQTAFNKGYNKLYLELDYLDWDDLDDVDWENLGRVGLKLSEEEQLFIQDKAKEYFQAKNLQSAVQNFVLALDASQKPKDMEEAAIKLREAIYATGVFGTEPLNEEQDASALLELLMLWIGTSYPFEITRTSSSGEIQESHPISILQVPIQEEMNVQNQLLDLFTTKNVNDPNNAININGSLESQYDEKIGMGREPPEQILLQFKRFKNDGTKIRDPLYFPQDHILDLSLGFIGIPANYKLTGAIQHVGDSIAKGHYVSFLLKDEHWYRVSDDEVTSMNASNVERMLAHSYILLLEKY